MLRRALVAFLIIGLLAGALGLGGPRLGRYLVLRHGPGLVEERTGCRLSIQSMELRFTRVEASGLALTCPGDAQGVPLAAAARIEAAFSPLQLLARRFQVEWATVDALDLRVNRRRDGQSSLARLLSRVRPKARGARTEASESRLRLGPLYLRSGSLRVLDEKSGVEFSASTLSGTLHRGQPSSLAAGTLLLRARRLRQDITFERAVLEHDPRRGSWPRILLSGGSLKLLPLLTLTGISGTLEPRSKGQGLPRIDLSLAGGYGGAKAQLWSAGGWVDPEQRLGELTIEAKRFSLGRIDSLLRRSPIIRPQQTQVDAKLRARLAGSRLDFTGRFAISGLNLFHPALARTPVTDLAGSLSTEGSLDLEHGRLQLTRLTAATRGVQATVSGLLERRLGVPYIDLSLTVPPLPCQAVLDSLPPPIVPELQGFKLKGTFAVDLKAQIDFRKLDALKLGGSVGINRCTVLQAPDWASAERLQQPFEHQVEAEPGVFQVFVVGPDNDDFTPFAQVSPFVVKALLTTEDGGFFRHRGFITSQFRAALARNLTRGGFRLGASTITMQMVKNVLLSHNKTLSRKLQELFLTWYLEHKLTKERILEIYLNAIEFGPGIYGIGHAARHYFGKRASDLGALEAAFLSTILPSPKRRYSHYCQGQLSPKWDAYTRRVLRRMHQKGHITSEELAAAEGSRITFVRNLDELPIEECHQRLDTLLESWDAENRARLHKAISEAAPDKLDLYLPPSQDQRPSR